MFYISSNMRKPFIVVDHALTTLISVALKVTRFVAYLDLSWILERMDLQWILVWMDLLWVIYYGY